MSQIDLSSIEELLDTIDKARNWYWDDPERHRRGRLNLVLARRELVRLAFSRLEVVDTELAEQMADAYSIVRDNDFKLAYGSIDALKYFRNQGLRMALISNGSSEVQRRKIQKFKLAPFFDHILIEGEFGAGKPDERVFRHTLKELEVTPDEAWMVGDDLERDISGAQALGIYSIWVDLTDNGLPESTSVKPDKIIRTLAELLERT